MHRRIVLLDGVYELVLAASLLALVAAGRMDGSDVPEPVGGVPVALFAAVLIPFGVVLVWAARRNRVSAGVLLALAAVNAAFALGIGAWAAGADGFSTLGSAVTWSTAVVVAALAAVQLAVRARGLPGAPRATPSAGA